MMTLKEFVKSYSGEKVDWDGHFGAQCVDLARQYFHEVWNIPQPEGVEGAKDFFLLHEKRPIQNRYCYCQTYYPGMQPPDGAVVIFGENMTNRYGHIGICIRSDNDGVVLFEQDGFKQDGAKVVHWPYSRVLGWLLKKEV